MEWSISQVDFPEGITPEETEILLGIDAGLDDSYGRTYLVRHDGALKALHRGGMVGTFEVAKLYEGTPPRIEAGKWGDDELVLMVEGGRDGSVAEKRLSVTHHERDTTLEVLEGIYKTGDPGPELAALLELKLEAAHDDEIRERALAELVTLYAGPLSDEERAVHHLRALLGIRSDHAGAIDVLEELVERGSLPACEVLQDTYRDLTRYAALGELMVRKASLDPQRRLDHQLEAVRLFEKEASAPERALDVVLTALAEHPGSEELLSRADDLAESMQAWAMAAAGFRAAEQATEAPELDAKLLWRIGHAHRKAGDLEGATRAMQELTWLDPEHREALAELVSLFADQERHKPQVEALERLVELSTDDRERVGWLTQLANVFESGLGDVERGIATNRRILDISDHDDGALASLARLYEATERWGECVEALDRRAERAAVDKRATLLARAAEITEQQLGDEALAMDRWRGALRAMPGHVEAMEALTLLYTKHERWLELVNALEQHAIGVDDARAVAALKRAARVSIDRMGERERATACYERARELAPNDEEVLRALLDAYGRGTSPDPVLEVLDTLLGLEPERDDALAWHIQRADWRRRSKNLDGARADLQAALALRPEEVKDRVRLLLLKADLDAEVAPEEELQTLHQALELDPRSEEAFQRLEPLLRASEDREELAALYERRAGFVIEERSTWLCRAARVRARKLGDVATATKLVLEAHSSDWQNPEVVAALSEVGAQAGVWREVLDELEKRRRSIAEGERRRYGKAIDAFIEACRANAELDEDDVIIRAAHHYQRRGAKKRALKLFRRAYRRNREAADVETRIRELLKQLGNDTELIEHLREVLDDGTLTGDDERDLLQQLAEALERADRVEEAEQIRRRLALPTLGALVGVALVIAVAVTVYYFTVG